MHDGGVYTTLRSKSLFNNSFALFRVGGTGISRRGLKARCDARQEELAPWLRFCISKALGYRPSAPVFVVWTNDLGSR